jgi:Na(+)-translocating NADH:ubiquinone oxidoreductase C subunit
VEKEKTPFKETRIYPVVFMILITAFFVGILAFFYHSTKEKVKMHEDMTFNDDFNKYIKEIKTDNLTYFEAKKDTTLLGYAFFIQGKGLWGSVFSIVSLSPDLEKIIKLTITSQSETPGLGARITEAWFTDQFSDKIITVKGSPVKFNLVSENKAELNNDEIKQITGATLSTKAVTDMVYNEINRIKKIIKVNK